MKEDSMEEQGGAEIDPKAVRAAVLEVGGEWLLADDIQGEVTSLRERGGISRPHVPIQLIRAACEDLVEDGRFERRSVEIAGNDFVVVDDGAHVQYRRHPDDVPTTRRRRGAIVRHMMPMDASKRERSDLGDEIEDVCVTDTESLATALRGEAIHATVRLLEEDMMSLVNVGAVTPTRLDGRTVYQLRTRTVAEVVAVGADAIAAKSAPAEGPADVVAQLQEAPPAPSKEQLEELQAARESRAKAEVERDKLARWMRGKRVNVEEILGQEVIAPRVEVIHSVSKPVDEAEKGRILDEILNIEKEIENIAFDASERVKRLKKQIASLKNASTCLFREVHTRAYVETDWETLEDVWYAVDDDRELERQPIDAARKRARAKAVADGEATAETPTPEAVGSASEDTVKESAPIEGPTPLEDVRAAIVRVLSDAVDPMTQDDIATAIGTAFICPEGFEALIKMELGRAEKAGAIKLVQGKPRRWTTPEMVAAKREARPDAPSTARGDEDEDDEEPQLDWDDGADEPGADEEPDDAPPPAAAKRRASGRKKGAEARP